MVNLRKAAEMAIEAIMKGGVKEQAAAVYALRQALAQPEQQPVAAVISWEKSMITRLTEHLEPATFLYTAPPNREWVGLTDEQQHEFVRNYGGDVISKLALVKAIEAKLKEKNT